MAGPLDFLHPAHRADPYASFAALRESGPVALPGVGVAVGDHATCAALLRNPRMSSERRRSRLYAAALAAGLVADPEQELAEAPFLFRDPPTHTRLRGLVAKAFTRTVVARLEPDVEAITGRLLDAARDRGSDLEVVGDLAYPLPVAVICALLGVPAADHGVFAGWSRLLASSLDPQLGPIDLERVAAAQRAAGEFRAYFRDLFAARRAEPAEDLVTGLVQAEADGSRLSEQELLSTCILLLVAGHETTVSLIGNAVRALLVTDQWVQLAADPELAGPAAEETLRWDPPVQLTGRSALAPVDVAGHALHTGELALLVLGAAGRDPAVFPDPDRFDLARTPDDGALRHLAFSGGIHFCLGAPLARMEATVALRALALRLREPRLVAAQYKPNLVLRGLASLTVTGAELA
jgi:cytochrome P450